MGPKPHIKLIYYPSKPASTTVYVNTPVTVPPVAADEPTLPVTVDAAVIPPATTNAPSAPFKVPLVSLST